MILKSLELNSFRNVLHAKVEFKDGVNVLYGNNAQGKTNIIEAIRFFSECSSFRGANDRELIMSGKNRAVITAVFEKDGREQTVEVRFDAEKRREIYLNGAKTSPKEYIGSFNTVIFFPEQLSLIKNGPENRRKFADTAIYQLRPAYYSLRSRFERTLHQRNALLKSGDMRTLDIWDERFAKLSFLITKTRKNFVLRLEEFAKPYVKDISGGKEELSLKYVPSFDAEDENALYRELVKNRERDFEYGNTNAGAHKDDFETFLNGNDVKKFGSQGQQRSCVMSFKLAEAEITGNTRGEYPLILLDDVFSELDTSRREFITGKIMGKQVIITSCDPISSMENANKIYVENGGVTQG